MNLVTDTMYMVNHRTDLQTLIAKSLIPILLKKRYGILFSYEVVIMFLFWKNALSMLVWHAAEKRTGWDWTPIFRALSYKVSSRHFWQSVWNCCEKGKVELVEWTFLLLLKANLSQKSKESTNQGLCKKSRSVLLRWFNFSQEVSPKISILLYTDPPGCHSRSEWDGSASIRRHQQILLLIFWKGTSSVF